VTGIRAARSLLSLACRRREEVEAGRAIKGISRLAHGQRDSDASFSANTRVRCNAMTFQVDFNFSQASGASPHAAAPDTIMGTLSTATPMAVDAISPPQQAPLPSAFSFLLPPSTTAPASGNQSQQYFQPSSQAQQQSPAEPCLRSSESDRGSSGPSSQRLNLINDEAPQRHL